MRKTFSPFYFALFVFMFIAEVGGMGLYASAAGTLHDLAFSRRCGLAFDEALVKVRNRSLLKKIADPEFCEGGDDPQIAPFWRSTIAGMKAEGKKALSNAVKIRLLKPNDLPGIRKKYRLRDGLRDLENGYLEIDLSSVIPNLKKEAISVVRPATELEMSLLESSLKGGVAHETIQFLLHTSSGPISIDPIHGGRFHVSEIFGGFFSTLAKLVLSHSSPNDLLQVNHVHPQVDYILTTQDGNERIAIVGLRLTRADIRLADKLANQYQRPVKMTAVVPAGMVAEYVAFPGHSRVE